MTTSIMEDWLKYFDRKMGKGNRNVLLFLDNAPAYPSQLKLKNVKVVFFPPNTTASSQPLDQGIIQAKNLSTE